MDNLTLTREEMLKRLHTLPFCMTVTDLTSEGCLEVSVVSSNGTSYSWESFEEFDFSAYCLNGLSKNKVATIKEHIAAKSFFIEDLNRTQLKRIIPKKDRAKELSDVFVNFRDLPDERLEYLYCYSDIDAGVIYVFDDPEKLSDVLNAQYRVGTTWEEMDDDELKDYLAEYEGQECDIPFSYFD